MRSVVLLLLLAQTVPAPSSQPAPASAPQAAPAPAQPTAAYVPERVYDTRRHAFGDFEQMIAELAGADVVLVGEQHDDPNTHRLEQALLDGLRRRKVAVTVSLEMFERDVQDVLDGYLASAISETDFLKAARPWPRYASAYRPLVELAKAQGWPVVAANVPRRHAADVAKSGKSALDKLSDADRALAARELECPQDGYFDRFVAAMGNHGSKPLSTSADGDEQKRQTAATNERYYWSQCVKDETMAESIARAGRALQWRVPQRLRRRHRRAHAPPARRATCRSGDHAAGGRRRYARARRRRSQARGLSRLHHQISSDQRSRSGISATT
jgi:hypothetical protein